MTDAAPDWSLLPDRPEAFFGLEPGFDRKQLKRAYNRLLKQFKPEKFPQEFQRIREAYEELDTNLRYGRQRDLSAGGSEYWRKAAADLNSFPVKKEEPAEPELEPDAQEPSTEREALYLDDFKEHIETFRQQQQSGEKKLVGDPASAYASLAEREEKQPYDYFLLALLSDVVGNAERGFVDWLIRGLVQYPEDWGLYNLLFEYCRGPIPADEMPGLAAKLGNNLHGSQFYPISEQLWVDLLTRLPFDEWRDLLERTERDLKGAHAMERSVFLLRLLKRAFWLADDTWLQETHGSLEERFSELPEDEEVDLDLMEGLWAYRTEVDRFRNGDPIRERIHEVIRGFCECDDWVAERLFLECQLFLQNNKEALFNAFPIGETYPAAWHVWSVISWQVEDRTNMGEEPESNSTVDLKVMRFLERIEERTAAHRYGGIRTVLPVVYYTLLVLVMLVLPLTGLAVTVQQLELLSPRVAVILFFAWTPVFLFGIKERVLDRQRERLEEWLKGACYHEIQRGMLLEFLETSHMDGRLLRHRLQNLERADLVYREDLAYFFERDYALHFFALSQHFLV
ncbi:MAG: J domain-containing protein [Acidobacteriota bacterium]|nr:J domain-containing protein [Acidobacteriota bacterium]